MVQKKSRVFSIYLNMRNFIVSLIIASSFGFLANSQTIVEGDYYFDNYEFDSADKIYASLYTKNKLTGNRIKTGKYAARIGDNRPPSDVFRNKMVIMIKMTKKTIEINNEYPKPPFRTIDPIAPPIKTNKIHDTARAYLKCNSYVDLITFLLSLASCLERYEIWSFID